MNSIISIVRSIYASYSPEEIKNIPLQGMVQLVMQEGLKLKAYQDSLGNWTIGVGHTPAYEGEVWTLDQCFSQLITDIKEVGIFPVDNNLDWAKRAGTVRWWVLVNMSFNMGIDNLKQFQETLSAFKNKDWLGVIKGMHNSLWWSQVGDRSKELAYQVYYNEWVTEPLNSSEVAKLEALLNS